MTIRKNTFFSVRYAPPINTLQLKLNYTYAMHGNDYDYVRGTTPVDEFPVLKEKSWSNTTIALRADYLPFPNIRVFAEYSKGDMQGYAVDGREAVYYLNRFGADYLHGKTDTFVLVSGWGVLVVYLKEFA